MAPAELKDRAFDLLDWNYAIGRASKNWGDWRFCYEARSSNTDFRYLPIIQNVHYFQSFIFEFNLYRGTQRTNLECLRMKLAEEENPECFKSLYKIVEETLNQGREKRRAAISITSKILGMWRPECYPMWDRYARDGLRKIVETRRGYGFYAHSPEHYENYRDCIHWVRDSLRSQVERIGKKSQWSRRGFVDRVIDQALMKAGGYYEPPIYCENPAT